MRFRALKLAVLSVFFALAATAATAGATTAATAGAAAGSAGDPSACPSVTPAYRPAVTVSGADKQLVPGQPTSATLCRYTGIFQPGSGTAGLTLAGEAAVSGTAAQTLAASFDQLPAAPTDPTSCPSDDGKTAVVYFHYAGGTVDPVTVQLSGCGYSSNGFLVQQGRPSAVTQLTAPSAAFVRAHEATLEVRIDGPIHGLSLIVDTAGDVTSEQLILPSRHYSIHVGAGRDTVKLVRDLESPHSTTVRRVVTIKAGGSASVVFKAG